MSEITISLEQVEAHIKTLSGEYDEWWMTEYDLYGTGLISFLKGVDKGFGDVDVVEVVDVLVVVDVDVVEFKNEHLMRMKGYQKRSHLFFRCSVENARNKYKFSDEDIDTYLVTVGDVSCVEIPIDKFDFDRNEIKFGGDHSITVERPIIIFVQDEAIFKSYDGAKKFWKQKGKQKLQRKVIEEV